MSAITDWVPGNPLSWEAEVEGEKITFVTGRVLTYEPFHLLRYTVFDPNQGMEDIPDNHLHVTYTLDEQNGKTTLTVK